MNISQQLKKQQWYLLIILFIITIVFGYWFQSSKVADLKIQTVKNMTNFVQQIKIIDKKIVDLTWPGGLFEYEEFRQIYDNPESYYPLVCEAIKSSEFTEQQKIIIGHTMHGSDLSTFLPFAQYMLQILESGEVSQTIFDRMVFPTYDWNTTLIENYEKQEVSQFLQSLLKSEKVSDYLKNLILEDILTGKAKSYVNNM